MDTNKVTPDVQSDTSGDEVRQDAHPDQKFADEMAVGLRSLADMIQAYPELARVVDCHGLSDANIPISCLDNPRDILAAMIRAAKRHGARIDKKQNDDYAGADLKWGPIGLHVYARREQVCERVVLGTEVVTKTVKDPEALAAVPEVEVTEEVEIVDWVCTPLLKAADAEAVSS